MKIVFLGSGEFGIPSLDAIRKSAHKLVAVLTQSPHPAGRGRKIHQTPVAMWAKANAITCIETENVNSSEVIKKISLYKPDLAVVAAFGQKIANEFINLPSKGTINIHSSILPKYRGAAPINWAIINGDKKTGVTIFSLVEKMDAGPVCSMTETEILTDETADHLQDRLAQLAAPLILETLEKIADGSIVYTEQNHSYATLARKLKKNDGYIDFSEPAEILRRKILGLWSWPGASANYISKKTGKCVQTTFAFAHVIKTENPSQLAPGIFDENLHVICGKDALEIIKLKPAGGHLMEFKDFANGRKTCPGDFFAKIEK